MRRRLGRFRSVSTFLKQAPAGGQGRAQRVDAGDVLGGERRAPAFAPVRASGDFAPEIAFLAAQGVQPGLLLFAMTAARSAGVSAEQALLGEGLLGEEEDYYRALARHLRLPFYRGEIAIAAAVEAEPAIACGVAPLAPNRAGLRVVAAPRAAAVRYLLAQAAAGALPAGSSRSASPQRLSAMVRAQAASSIAEAASGALERYDAALSAHSGLSARQCLVLAAAAPLWFAAATLAPEPTALTISSALWALFAGAIVLRNLAVAAARSGPFCAPLEDFDLPLYTIIAPLRGEEGMVGKLTRALDALDYPRGKLDIKLVVERDDFATLTAICALRLPARYEIIVAPPGRPATKPRALNVALPAARGELVVVYDAEDEPDPNQLRLAAARFAADRSVDCLQAALTIENSGDSWLSAGIMAQTPQAGGRNERHRLGVRA